MNAHGNKYFVKLFIYFFSLCHPCQDAVSCEVPCCRPSRCAQAGPMCFSTWQCHTQVNVIVPCLILCDEGPFLAVPQSCFEASVNALLWINVMCGISQEAAPPLQWQRQEARKQPKAYTSTFRTRNEISLFFCLFFVTVCKVTHQQSKVTKEKKSKKALFDLSFFQKTKTCSVSLPTCCTPLCHLFITSVFLNNIYGFKISHSPFRIFMWKHII